MKLKYSLVLIFSVAWLNSFAQTSYTVASGCTASTCNWNSTSSWVGGVVPPSNAATGSTITIPVGIGIKLNGGGATSYTNDLTFNNNGNFDVTTASSRLSLSAGSIINTGPGSTMDGGNSSNRISIGSVELNGDDVDKLSGGPYSYNSSNLNCVNQQGGCPIIPLPIKLISFEGASINGSNVNLLWSTASEENFSYFELARSTNGSDFELFGTIKSTGSNTTIKQDYSFEDNSPYNGINYYQLTSVDFDGYRETFDMIAVQVNQTLKPQVFPNPVSNQRIFLNGMSTENLFSLYLLGLDGKVYFSVENAKEPTIDIYPHVSPAIYIARVTVGDQVFTQRIFVR